jgi:nucleoid DNA-binding protein
MTKKKIVQSVSTDLDIDTGQAQRGVQAVLDTVLESLAAEGRIELRNFGVFEVQRRAARRARNPRTGERVDMPETHRVTFKAGRVMQERIQGGPRQGSQPADAPPDQSSGP